nr:hypothetical protein [Tanacetum cinerariifolium]
MVPTVDSPTIPPIAPTIQYTSPFICTDSSDSDTFERPPSQDPYEVTVARWRSRVAARSSPPSSPTHDSPPITPPTNCSYLTRAADPYHFILDDSSRDSPSDSSSETSSESHSDTSSDSSLRHSSSGHSISDSPCDSPTAIFVGPSRKRRRSPTASVPIASPVPRALSPVRADLLSPRKRIRDSNSVTDFEVNYMLGLLDVHWSLNNTRFFFQTTHLEVVLLCLVQWYYEVTLPDIFPLRPNLGVLQHVPREIGLGVDVEDSYEPYTEPNIDLVAQADIDAYDTAEPVKADYLDLVSADSSLEEVYDHMVEIPVHRVKVIKSFQRDQGHRIVATSQQSVSMSEMISMLKWDNMRLRGISESRNKKEDEMILERES